MKFTIRCKGSLVGTYPGDTEEAALDAMAKDAGFADFAEYKTKRGVTRDDHKVEQAQ